MKEPRSYSETPKRNLRGFIDDNQVYSDAQDAFVLDCVDFVIVDRKHKLIWLPTRIVHSAKGIWRFGGRRKAGETMREALVRISKRELSLDVDPTRFFYICGQDCIWSWREQEPQDGGQHCYIHVFGIEFAADDYMQFRLDKNEYRDCGLRHFDREGLVQPGIRPQLLEMYDAIFPI